MKAQPVEIKESTGRSLCCTVFRAGGKKLLSKGHVISEDDVRLLETEGMQRVWVTELEEGEVGEDEAVMLIGKEVSCGSLEIRLAAGGRANLVATEDCCVLVDDELLRQINCASSAVVATLANLSYASAEQRIATVKSAPFAVSRTELETLISLLKERGPVLQARPLRNPAVAVLYTDPLTGDRARQLFDGVMRQRLERFGVSMNYSLAAVEDETSVARSLDHLVRAKPALVLVASTTAPAGPEDIVGRAVQGIGCHIERFLVPVEPGNLLLLAYKNDVPIVCAPGCYRSAKPNVVDLLLPPLLARYRITGWELASLGHGGLLG
jgi:molybdenum cofactor cytidylyltransferase